MVSRDIGHVLIVIINIAVIINIVNNKHRGDTNTGTTRSFVTVTTPAACDRSLQAAFRKAVRLSVRKFKQFCRDFARNFQNIESPL